LINRLRRGSVNSEGKIVSVAALPRSIETRHVLSHRIVESATTVTTAGPGGIGCEVHDSDSRTITVFRDAEVYPKYGLVVVGGEALVQESLLKIQRKFETGKLQLPKRRKRVSTPVFGLKLSSNYYHFWRECVVPMLLLREPEVLGLGELTVTVTSPLAPWQQQVLEQLLPDGARLLQVEKDVRIQSPLTVVPSVYRTRVLSPEVVARLRSIVQQVAGSRMPLAPYSDGSGTLRAIYISRRSASRRRPTNEHLLLDGLRARGVPAVTLEAMDPRDGLALFADAEIVIGQHGAGLTNLIGCRGPTSVLEIFGVPLDGSAPSHYRALTGSLGFNYSAVSGGAKTNAADVELPVSDILDWIDSRPRLVG
jgi:hypothetical protein